MGVIIKLFTRQCEHRESFATWTRAVPKLLNEEERDPFLLEARRSQNNVGAGEGLSVALLDETRFIHATLYAKRGHETIEGPAILPPLAQIVTINAFGLLGTAGLEETVSRFYPGGESVIGKIEANLVAKWMFRIHM